MNVSLHTRMGGLWISVWMLAVAVTATGQTTTTKARVYTAAQATRGEELYMTLCVTCHPPATYTGAVFKTWQGKSLGELLEYLQERMPKSDPGSLSEKEYADVIAYLLKLNKMPTGRTDLPADVKTLRTISIDILPQ